MQLLFIYLTYEIQVTNWRIKISLLKNFCIMIVVLSHSVFTVFLSNDKLTVNSYYIISFENDYFPFTFFSILSVNFNQMHAIFQFYSLFCIIIIVIIATCKVAIPISPIDNKSYIFVYTVLFL